MPSVFLGPLHGASLEPAPSLQGKKPLKADGSSHSEQKSVHVPSPERQQLIIYPSGICVIKDVRKVALRAGHNSLIFENIPSAFKEDSLLIRSVDKLPLIFMEFSFDPNLLTFQNLLEKTVGQNVYVLTPLPGQEASERLGRLLAVDKQEALVRIDNQIERVSVGTIAFQSVPNRLSLSPLLYLSLKSPLSQETDLELTYITSGFSWSANYTLEISSQQQTANMMGWMAIKNMTGIDFRNAQVQLAASSDGVSSLATPLSASHLYPLMTSTSLYNRATKKVSFLSATQMKVSREYRVEMPPLSSARDDSIKPLVAKVWSSIRPTLKDNVGMPIPAGRVRLYINTPTHTRYAGTFSIRHTNVGGTFSVPLEACAFIDAQIQQIDLKQLGHFITEHAFRLVVTNKHHQSIALNLVQKLPPDTILVRSSLQNHKLIDDAIFWSVDLPPNESLSLRYRTRTTKEVADSAKLSD
jgi:hypothetical protein